MHQYTSIRVKLETKRLLDRVRAVLEARLGRRLDYDSLIRLLAEERLGREERRPELLLELFKRPVAGHDTDEALRLLRGERARDERL